MSLDRLLLEIWMVASSDSMLGLRSDSDERKDNVT